MQIINRTTEINEIHFNKGTITNSTITIRLKKLELTENEIDEQFNIYNYKDAIIFIDKTLKSVASEITSPKNVRIIDTEFGKELEFEPKNWGDKIPYYYKLL